MSFGPRFTMPDGDGEYIEGYAYDAPNGERVEVPATTIRDGAPAPYRNVAMTRDEAFDVAIAFGLENAMPCHPTPNGAGFDVTIPAEYLRGILEAIGKLPL